ncbi:MAG: circadian clock protein KaiB [Frankiaceae bacterium]|jgi:circadian clock protein KaiB|nr:circadian clock protein KaiB [Frankiaceae bacterium]
MSVDTVPPPEFWSLRLYIAGQSPRSLRAMANLANICERHLSGRYEIEVIDLAETPSLAKTDDIVAIPTLVRWAPAPSRKVIGDLSDADRALAGLHIAPTAGP